jgi:hypothetical protein
MIKERVTTYLREAAQRRANPARFNHPLALEIEWTPLKGGGATFRTHDLHEMGPDRIEFRQSVGFRLILGFFIVGGAILFVLNLPGMPMHALLNSNLLRAIVMIASALVPLCLMVVLIRPDAVVFDRVEGFFWNGRRKGMQMPARHCALETIAGLQILAEDVSGADTSPGHWSYELNLVLNDGERLNVVDHGSLKDVRAAAERIQMFLPVRPPIWDATEDL